MFNTKISILKSIISGYSTINGELALMKIPLRDADIQYLLILFSFLNQYDNVTMTLVGLLRPISTSFCTLVVRVKCFRIKKHWVQILLVTYFFLFIFVIT